MQCGHVLHCFWMPTSQELLEAKRRAESTIRSSWRDIASDYTLGWGGPVEAIEKKFPGFAGQILDIRQNISADLPVVIFQRRLHPESDTVFAVPFWKESGNPFNSRLVTLRTLSPRLTQTISMFAQSFWFLVSEKVLPAPGPTPDLERTMRRWTGRELFE